MKTYEAKTWGVSVQGPLHIKENLPNQDYWQSKNFEWGSVVAVSDGLGSKKHSDIGSRLACEAVIKAAEQFIKEPFSDLDNLTKNIHAIWVSKLETYFISSPNDAAATCLFVIQYNEHIILGQLGDGMISALGSDDEFELLIDDKELGFSNTTVSLAATHYQHDWRLKKLSAVQFNRFLLCTDGISDDLISENTNAHKEFCKSIISIYHEMQKNKRERELKKMLEQWPVKGHTDDKTLAVLVLE